jgi:putative spermidine/putrescine transport system substrate-binding protein
VSNLNEVAKKVKEDLGFTLEMTALDSDSVTQRAATQPDSFDIADIEYWICKKVWPTGNLQAMDTSQDQELRQDRRHLPQRQADARKRNRAGHGAAHGRLRRRQGRHRLRDNETGWMTLIPTIYNADTLGIRPDLIGRPINNWSELLNPEFKGKASILDISSIGIMDMAMVCEAMGEITYGDKGNMTREEIDKTIAIFTEAKKNGQFRAFWKSFDERQPDGVGRGCDPVDVVARDHRGEVEGHPLRLPAARRKAIAHGAAASACRPEPVGPRAGRGLRVHQLVSPAGSAAS